MCGGIVGDYQGGVNSLHESWMKKLQFCSLTRKEFCLKNWHSPLLKPTLLALRRFDKFILIGISLTTNLSFPYCPVVCYLPA